MKEIGEILSQVERGSFDLAVSAKAARPTSCHSSLRARSVVQLLCVSVHFLFPLAKPTATSWALQPYLGEIVLEFECTCFHPSQSPRQDRRLFLHTELTPSRRRFRSGTRLEGFDDARDVRSRQVAPQPKTLQPFPKLVFRDLSLFHQRPPIGGAIGKDNDYRHSGISSFIGHRFSTDRPSSMAEKRSTGQIRPWNPTHQ